MKTVTELQADPAHIAAFTEYIEKAGTEALVVLNVRLNPHGMLVVDIEGQSYGSFSEERITNECINAMEAQLVAKGLTRDANL